MPPMPRAAMSARPRGIAFAALACLVLLGGCAVTTPAPERAAPPLPSPPAPSTHRLPDTVSELPGWALDDVADALPVFLRSCDKLERLSVPAAAPSPVGAAFSWRRACAAADVVPAGDEPAARQFFERWFRPHRPPPTAPGGVLVTGYYEPLVRGSMRRSGRFTVPLLRLPPPVAGGGGAAGPMPTRAEIEAGALSGMSLEFVWLDDPIDAFFLHIQGSGVVALEDGRRMRVGYAGRNGHPYVAIGRELIDRGAIEREQMSMQAIRAWLAAHPDQAAEVMALNPSYIFFRRIEDHRAGDGPIGAQGVPLTPERSIAVDPAFVPLGAPVWLETFDPRTPGRPLRRLVVAQDTGSAIRGPGRADLFWGAGEAAADAAGRMKERGRMTVLLPTKRAAGP
jgi:membrane-bound lytic murein transglycosylase A